MLEYKINIIDNFCYKLSVLLIAFRMDSPDTETSNANSVLS